MRERMFKTTETKTSSVTIIQIDPGSTVFCDLCGKDYTESNIKGGFIFQSKAVCPICADRFLKEIKKYKEEKFIRSKAYENEAFRDFIYRIRKK